MAGFLNKNNILEYSKQFEVLHDTFARDVVIIKESKRILVREVDENYNYFYDKSDQRSLEQEAVPVSGVFKMRVQWMDPAREFFGGEASEVRPKIHDNLCRLKMKRDAFDFIDGYKKIIIDGKNCEWVGSSRPHGLVDIQFYTVFVKETN